MEPNDANADDLEYLLNAALRDLLPDTADATTVPRVPERPQMTAENTEAYVRAHEELEADIQHTKTLWENVEAADRVRDDVMDRIKFLAFQATGSISPAALQALLVRHDTGARAYRDAKANIQTYYAALEQNIMFFNIQTADIQAHRDAQYALLRPGQAPRVPVDTPTAGPRVTDEDALLRDYGVDLGM